MQTGSRAWRRLAAPGLATLVALAILVSLGVWQLGRRAWKEAVIARIEARVSAEPVSLPPASDWGNLVPEGYAYLRVRAAGAFRHDLEARVQANLPGPSVGAPVLGYDLLTPLVLPDGATVIVNRGFVPRDLADSGELSRPAGQVEIVGLLREPERRGAFTPPDDPARNVFYANDPAAIGAAKGLDAPARVAPFVLAAEIEPRDAPTRRWPQGGRTRLALPNDHLSYALTWFGLAAALLGVFGVYARRALAGP